MDHLSSQLTQAKPSPDLRACLPRSPPTASAGFFLPQLHSLGLGPSVQHFVSIPQLKNKDNNPLEEARRINELIIWGWDPGALYH